MKLVSKTTLLLGATVSTALVVACGLLLRYQEQSLKHTLCEGVDAQAKLAARGIEAFTVESLREAGAIALTLPVEALRQGRMDAVESHLRRMAEAFPEFRNGIFILDQAGRFLVDYPSHPELRGQSFAFRDYYRRTIQEDRGIVGEPYQSKRTGLPVLTVTAPVHDGGGRIVAVVACSMDLLSQQTLGGYHAQRFGRTGYLYVFDRSRLLILHPERERLLTKVEAGKNKILEAALDGFEGAGETVNSKGVPMLIAVRRVRGTEWTAAVQVTQEEAYAPVAAARKRIALVAGLTILLAIGIGSLAARRVSKPLRRLDLIACQIRGRLEDAERAGSYDLPQSVFGDLAALHDGDEVGSLASSIRELATRLNLTLASLQRSAEEWRWTFDSVDQAIALLAPDGRVVGMNCTAEAWFGVSLREAQGRVAHAVFFGDETAPPEWPDIASLRERQRARWSRHLERRQMTLELTLTPVTASGGNGGAVLVASDITARLEMELELRQAHKLEAVGRLADGVAHDFNNMLAVILSTGRFVREELAPDHPLREAAEDIIATADRAASLTRQLLDFSRHQAIDPQTFDLVQALSAEETMLRRIVGEEMELELLMPETPCWVRAVPSQIEQVVMNLAVNARDAMPAGGKITVQVAPVEAGDPALRGDALPPGAFLMLAVTDTGVGMDEATQARIFEPFFTTKAPGKGTGLGLATVYGVVQRSGGVVRVTSAPAKGTTFRIYLPRVVPTVSEKPATPPDSLSHPLDVRIERVA